MTELKNDPDTLFNLVEKNCSISILKLEEKAVITCDYSKLNIDSLGGKKYK